MSEGGRGRGRGRERGREREGGREGGKEEREMTKNYHFTQRSRLETKSVYKKQNSHAELRLS